MQSRNLSSALLVLAACMSQATADTMYKCVDAAGKISYTGQPCHGKANEAKAFKVAAPLDNQTLAAAEAERLRKLDVVKAGLASRESERSNEGRREAEQYRPAGVIVRGPDKPKPVILQKSKQQLEQELQDARREHRCGVQRRQGNPDPRGCLPAVDRPSTPAYL